MFWEGLGDMRIVAGILSLLLFVSAVPALAQSGSLFDVENARVAEPARRKTGPNAPLADEVASVPYALTREHGPILIKVASFIGDEHLTYAVALATELRERHQLPTHIFRYQAKLEGGMTKKEEEEYEKQFLMKPRKFVPVNEPPINFVVLVGDFPSIEDAAAQKTLQRLRKIDVQSVPAKIWDQYRMSAIEDAKGKAKKNQPLASAMLVPNPHPKAPKFQKSIAPEVAKMIFELNSSSPFSIYENRHPYTLAVAQFSGTSVYGSNDKEKGLGVKMFGVKGSPLSEAAQQAISVADALRKLGWEAYVFHGQYASMVCIGGFPELGDMKDPRMKDLRYRVVFMDQHPEVMKLRQRIAEIKLADMQLSPNAQIMLTPRPPQGMALGAMAD
jgi:hypothetical protein